MEQVRYIIMCCWRIYGIICDVSSEKVPEPSYVNIEKIAKTRPKVNFAEFLFIGLNDYLPTKEWFLRIWRKIVNVLVVFELVALVKASIRHFFLNVRTALHHLPRLSVKRNIRIRRT